MNSDLVLDETEFIALNAETIKNLVESHQDREAPGNTRRRRLPRWPFPATVQLWAADRAGRETQYFGTCQNLNVHGIGVASERPFDIGRALQIALHQPEATYHGRGVVRHCTSQGQEYFVGIEFVEPPTDPV